MGEVCRNFMPLRMAQRYVEVYRHSGKTAAENWWRTFHWMPTQEEVAEMQKEVNRILSAK